MSPLLRVIARTSVVAGGVFAVLATTVPAFAAPDSDFEMPFPCGQSWTGTTRSSHSPTAKAIDWNRTDDDGDPVVAAASGVVSVADAVDNGGYGKWVTIDHEGTESTIYAHLSGLAVKAGQAVDQGSVIGYVGTTGNSTGPHLHFEERVNKADIEAWFHGTKFVYGSTLTSQNCVDVPLAANMVGGLTWEVVVYRRASASTFIVHRTKRDPKVITFGTSTDEPVLGDWDGDGRANVGVLSPATKTFSLVTPVGVTKIAYGAVGDKPVAGDWDGDGTWEIGVRRPAKGAFKLRAANGSVTTILLGDANDVALTGDWDGNGVTDLAVYDQATATYTLRLVGADGFEWTAKVPFGEPGDLPVVGDWDGNLKTDLGVWDPEAAVFSQRRAPKPTVAARSVTTLAFGNPR